jgi:hypothetical protein
MAVFFMVVISVGSAWHRMIRENKNKWRETERGSWLIGGRMGSQIEFAKLPVQEDDSLEEILAGSHAVVRVRIDQELSPKKCISSGCVGAKDQWECCNTADGGDRTCSGPATGPGHFAGTSLDGAGESFLGGFDVPFPADELRPAAANSLEFL